MSDSIDVKPYRISYGSSRNRLNVGNYRRSKACDEKTALKCIRPNSIEISAHLLSQVSKVHGPWDTIFYGLDVKAPAVHFHLGQRGEAVREVL